jgi:hypothetical protein
LNRLEVPANLHYAAVLPEHRYQEHNIDTLSSEANATTEPVEGNAVAVDELPTRRDYTCGNCGVKGHSRRCCPNQVLDVECILEHRGTLTNMRFLVRWIGSREETWETMSNLKDNAIFLKYIEDNELTLHL